MFTSIKKQLKRKSPSHQIYRLHYHKHHWEPISEKEPTVKQTIILLGMSVLCLIALFLNRMQRI